MKKTLMAILIIIIICIFYFSNFLNEKKSEALIIDECLSLLYNIPSANELDEYSENDELTRIDNKYQEFLSENGFNKIRSDRLHLLYREVAKKEQLTIELKNIETKKVWVKEKDASVLNKYKKIGYEYKVELFIEYVESGKTETIYEEDYINLAEIDGEWKVDLVMYKVLNEVFKKSIY